MVEFAQSYDSEMVRNFNNFKAFVMFDYAYISPENFLDSPPPSTTFSGKICTTWSKS